MLSAKTFTRLVKFQTKIDPENGKEIPAGDHAAIPLLTEEAEKAIFDAIEKGKHNINENKKEI